MLLPEGFAPPTPVEAFKSRVTLDVGVDFGQLEPPDDRPRKLEYFRAADDEERQLACPLPGSLERSHRLAARRQPARVAREHEVQATRKRAPDRVVGAPAHEQGVPHRQRLEA